MSGGCAGCTPGAVAGNRAARRFGTPRFRRAGAGKTPRWACACPCSPADRRPRIPPPGVLRAAPVFGAMGRLPGVWFAEDQAAAYTLLAPVAAPRGAEFTVLRFGPCLGNRAVKGFFGQPGGPVEGVDLLHVSGPPDGKAGAAPR